MSGNQQQLIVNPFLSYELETVNIIKHFMNLKNEGKISQEKFEKEKNKALENRKYENLRINRIKPKKNAFYILAGIWLLCVGLFGLISNIKSIFDFAFTDLFAVICGIIVGMSTLRLAIAYLIRKDKAIAVYSFVYFVIMSADFVLNVGFGSISRLIFYACYCLSFVVMGLGFIFKSKKKPTKVYAIIAAVLNFSYYGYYAYVSFKTGVDIDAVVMAVTLVFEFVFICIFPILAFSIKDKISKKGKQTLEKMKFAVLEANNLVQEYTSLLDSGAISQQDFDNKKAYILSKMA